MEMSNLLSTAYLPSIAWFQHALNGEAFYIESQENYVKQSYRNRSKILTANGVLDLIIQLNENEAWRKQHWQAICSAYGKSAFFLYYRDALEHLYFGSNQKNLFDWNYDLLKLLIKLLKLDLQPQFTKEFEKLPMDKLDLRNAFGAKGNPPVEELLFPKKYYQVFAEKFEFVPNLSVLDLLFNVGPISGDYLR
jgi:hypothetical protein